jgi:hypothetical protein
VTDKKKPSLKIAPPESTGSTDRIDRIKRIDGDGFENRREGFVPIRRQ